VWLVHASNAFRDLGGVYNIEGLSWLGSKAITRSDELCLLLDRSSYW
jgi:hypothetical protein